MTAEERAEEARRQQLRDAHANRLERLKARKDRSRKIDDRIAYVEELFKEEGDGAMPDPAFV